MGGLSTKQKEQPGRTAMAGAGSLSNINQLLTNLANMSVKLFHIGLSGGLKDECSTIPCMAPHPQVEKQKQNKISVAFRHRQLVSACFILLLRFF